MKTRKKYIKPLIARYVLDNTISLAMMSEGIPNPGDPRGGNKGGEEPFSSPFNDKPFS